MNEILRKFFAPGVPSDQWQLNKYDLIKAAILTIFAPVILMLTEALMKFFNGKDPLEVDWLLLGKTAGACFFGYILKNFFSPSSNPPLK